MKNRGLSAFGLYLKVFFLGFGSLGVCSQSFAWGPLGHRMISETAALLIEENSQMEGANEVQKAWGKLLSRHRFELGYYSMIPDSLYRHLDQHGGTEEAPTHYLDVDLIFGQPASLDFAWDDLHLKKLAFIPLHYNEAQKYFKEKLGKKADQVGSVPWRVEQFLDLSQKEFSKIQTLTGSYTKGENATGDVKAVFWGLYYLGVLSHYTGDSLMPYHSSSDWNGYSKKQGGIHFYFESDCVNALEPGLSTEVLRVAKKEGKNWMDRWRKDLSSPLKPAELMLRVLLDSATQLQALSKIDLEKVVLKPSEGNVFAERKPAKVGCEFFKEMITERLAKAAVLTQYLWDSVLPKTITLGKPDTLQFSDMKWTTTYIPFKALK